MRGSSSFTGSQLSQVRVELKCLCPRYKRARNVTLSMAYIVKGRIFTVGRRFNVQYGQKEYETSATKIETETMKEMWKEKIK